LKLRSRWGGKGWRTTRIQGLRRRRRVCRAVHRWPHDVLNPASKCGAVRRGVGGRRVSYRKSEVLSTFFSMFFGIKIWGGKESEAAELKPQMHWRREGASNGGKC
jgi:hypothetical protein